MKKVLFLVLIATGLMACDNETKVKVDLDSMGKKFDSSAESLMDTTRQKLKDLKDRIENKLENKDSTNR